MAEREPIQTPPIWNIQTTSYEDWTFDLQLWNDWTKVDKARRGFLVFKCLPEKKGVNEKVRLAIQAEDIKLDSEDAVAKILTVLDKSFKKDDFSVICETWSAFINMRKKRPDNMDEYIGLFERKVGELKKRRNCVARCSFGYAVT